MCFDNEGDWCATVNEIEDVVANHACKCFECNREIRIGETVRQVHQQECEFCECDFCCNEESPDEDYTGPDKCQEELGETFDCVVCLDCCNLLKAIEAHEIAEGCPEHARQPLYGELHEVFLEHQQNYEYAERAVDMFPSLYGHRFIEGLLA